MQQQRNPQNRNLILFVLLSFGIIVGYSYVKNWIWPPPPPPDPPPQAKAVPKVNVKDTALQNLFGHPFSATDPGAGLAGATTLALDADYFGKAFPIRPLTNMERAKLQLTGALASTMTPGGDSLAPTLGNIFFTLWRDGTPASRIATDFTKSRPKSPPISLGSEVRTSDFFLKAKFDARGACVREVTLNRFKKADRLGRPVEDEIMVLVEEDQNSVIGSYLLYHVANPKDSQERPLNTLGEVTVWETLNAPFAGKVVSWDKETGKLEAESAKGKYTFYLTGPSSPIPALEKIAEPDALQAKLDALKPGADITLIWANSGNRLILREVNPAADHPWFNKVAFGAAVQKVILTKTFSIDPRTYHLGLDIKIEAAPDVAADQEVPFRYHITSAHGLPVEGEWYTSTFRNAMVGMVDQNGYGSRSLEPNLAINAKGGGDEALRKGGPNDADRKAIQFGGVGIQYFGSQVVVTENDVSQMYIERARPTVVSSALHGTVKSVNLATGVLEVVGNDKQEYKFHVPFALEGSGDRMMAVEQGIKANMSVPVALTWMWSADDRRIVTSLFVGTEASGSLIPEAANIDINVHLITELITVKPGQPKEHHYLLYNGPLKIRLLAQLAGDMEVPNDLVGRYHDALHLATMTDAPWQWFGQDVFRATGLTWLLLSTTNLMHLVLWAIHTYVCPWSWGISIILLTLIVRAMMHPLSRRATLNSLKMQALQPQLKKLREKYKDDQQALGLAQMELYRKNKVSLTGSCWTMFLQMPIFMGLYWCLQESIHFRLAPFWDGMPWWLQNLAAPDMLFNWQWMPVISDPATTTGFLSFLYLGPFFNLLPVVAAALMMIVQRMMMPPATTEQEEMQRSMMKYMPIIMAVMFFKVASGLCIYFIVSSLWGLAERKLLLPKKIPDIGEPEIEGKKDDAKPSLFAMALEKLNEASKPRETSAPATNGSVPAASDQNTGGKKNRKQRKKDKQKKGKGGGNPSPPSTNGGAKEPPGFMDKVRAWVEDVLKKAEKR